MTGMASKHVLLPADYVRMCALPQCLNTARKACNMVSYIDYLFVKNYDMGIS